MDLDKSGIKDQQGIVWIVSGNRRLYAFGLSGTILGDALEMTRARYKQIPLGDVKVYRGQKGSAVECRNLITFDIFTLIGIILPSKNGFRASRKNHRRLRLRAYVDELRKKALFYWALDVTWSVAVSFHRFLMDFEIKRDMSEVKAFY